MSNAHRNAVVVAAAATLLMAITMGSRTSFGLFVSPLNTATGLGLITISFAGALNQLAWGAAQPFVGMAADRWGAARVIAAGALALAAGTALIPFARGGTELVWGFTLIGIANAVAGSNGMLLGAAGRAVAAERRGFVLGIVGAGGSAGQLVLGPVTQGVITTAGWHSAMFALAALALVAVPLALAFRGNAAGDVGSAAPPQGMRDALESPAFWCVTGGFFVCGFHVSFLVAHMPGVIASCNLPASLSGHWLAIIGVCNIVGSLAAGAAIRRGSMKRALIVLYLLRAIGVALFLVLPKTEAMLLAFAGWMGLTYMATLPPTAGLIGKLFGLRRMATLLGIVMFVHQIGAFLGVWLGGIAVTLTGSYDWIWYADIALALLAAAIHVPLRENRSADAAAPVTTAARGLQATTA